MTELYTNTDFVKYLKEASKKNIRYWFGCVGYKCTDTLYEKKKKQYPTHYTSNRISQYKKDIAEKRICTDCIGLLKSYMWTKNPFEFLDSDRTNITVQNIYKANNMPDASANSYFTLAKKEGMDWGTIDTIPEIPGIAVTYSGHIGYYIGNGEVVEARGFNYGVVTTKLKNRPWKNWYKIPCLKYGKVSITLGSRTLKKGMKGDDVKELQQKLIQLGYNLGKYGADGDFGEKTDAAVRTFQQDNNLTIDGIVGKKTITKLIG